MEPIVTFARRMKSNAIARKKAQVALASKRELIEAMETY